MKDSKLAFRHFLQQSAMKLANGEVEKIEFNLQQICNRYEGLENPPQHYFRNAINSYAPFKATGQLCKVSTRSGNYTITLVEGGQASVTPRNNDKRMLVSGERAVLKIVQAALSVKVDASHLTGKQLEAFQAGADAYRVALVAELEELNNHG